MPSLTLWSEANSLWLFFSVYFVASLRRIQVKRSAPLPLLERVCLLLAAALVFFPRTHLSFLANRFHRQPRPSL